MREARHEWSKIISKGDAKLGKQAATKVVLKHRVEEVARHKEEAPRLHLLQEEAARQKAKVAEATKAAKVTTKEEAARRRQGLKKHLLNDKGKAIGQLISIAPMYARPRWSRILGGLTMVELIKMIVAAQDAHELMLRMGSQGDE